jgi:hypothetical protein
VPTLGICGTYDRSIKYLSLPAIWAHKARHVMINGVTAGIECQERQFLLTGRAQRCAII